MPSEKHEEKARELVGQLFEREDLPDYPGRIYWHDGGFIEGLPYYPARVVEVRFAEASLSNGVFRVDEARAVDTSNPDDVYGEWYNGR